MIQRIGFAATLVLAVAFADRSSACTIFKIVLNGRTFAGNNEAWSDPNTKVWFLTAEKGKYGRVFFGYRNGYAQGGMNERGLFYDWVAGYKTDWKRDGGKMDYPGNFSERVLEEAASVEEAIALYEASFEKYNDNSFAAARILLVDRSGGSAIIGWENGRLKITRGDGPCQVLGWDQEATERRLKEMEAASQSGVKANADVGVAPAADDIAGKNANESSKSANAIIEAVSSVLSACQQTGTYRTFYSNVYDLQAGKVHVYQFQAGIPPVTFDLADELAKGSHCYDLPKLSEQLKLPPATDGRTLTRIPADPAMFAAVSGDYELAPGARLTVSTRDEKLFVQAPGEPAYELWPASRTKYFLGFADIQLTFELDESGRAKSVLFHTWEKELKGVRAKQASTQPATAPASAKSATNVDE